MALFSLIQSTLEIWFGMLFANILQLKDCLELWDHFFMHGTDFLFQFSLSVINHLDSKLVEVIKREKQKLSSLGIEDNPQASFAIVSSLKTVFMTALTREEFQAVLTAAKEKSLEVIYSIIIKEKSYRFYRHL